MYRSRRTPVPHFRLVLVVPRTRMAHPQANDNLSAQETDDDKLTQEHVAGSAGTGHDGVRLHSRSADIRDLCAGARGDLCRRPHHRRAPGGRRRRDARRRARIAVHARTARAEDRAHPRRSEQVESRLRYRPSLPSRRREIVADLSGRTPEGNRHGARLRTGRRRDLRVRRHPR